MKRKIDTKMYAGGKAARARAARNGIDVVTDLEKHRPCGGAPTASDLEEDSSNYHHILSVLEEAEKVERIKFRTHLINRKEVPMDNHGSMIVPATARAGAARKKNENEGKDETNCSMTECDLSEKKLREFTLELMVMSPVHVHTSICIFTSLTSLDMSRNELWTLPSSALQSIPNLQYLNLSRNWFAELPKSIAHLSKLKSLNVSHNMLRSSHAALLMCPSESNCNRESNCTGNPQNQNQNDTIAIAANNSSGEMSILQSLTRLEELDLRFNQKCNHQKLKIKIQKEIPSVEVKMTINNPRPEGLFVGDSAADRDPLLLRSQLEPWSTTSLRRRLVADFGDEPTSPDDFTRGDVMNRLLKLYADETEPARIVEHQDEGGSKGGDERHTCTYARRIVRSSGTLVEESLRNKLLLTLRAWKQGWTNKNLERTSIRAENYMILTSPSSWEPLGRKKRQKAEAKLEAHKEIWDIAQEVMASVDADFSSSYTALAVTHNFQGSPHIDRQNIGPFYGISLGDFEDGTGGIMVECSARIVAHVNTKDRLGKVDGRFPHWVAPYDVEKKERFSLIFYQTMGDYTKIGPAVFNLES